MKLSLRHAHCFWYTARMLPDLSNSLVAAESLLGWKLVHKTQDGITAGYIVETESYDMNDPASHAFSGPSMRNSSMFEPAGTIYVYFTYGMHYCVNIVTGNRGEGQAVLIRALQPTDGIDLMKHRRRKTNIRELCSGPAKLTQAMAISKQHNGLMLGDSEIYLEPGIKPGRITQTTRIGISKATDNLWRFYIANNSYISRK